MKTIGKIGLGFFCAFFVLAIASTIVFASTGGFYDAAQKVVTALNNDGFNFYFDFDGYNGNISDYDFNEGNMDFKDGNVTSVDGIKTIKIDADVCAVELHRADVQDITTEFKSGKSTAGDYAKMEALQQQGEFSVTVKQKNSVKWFGWNHSDGLSQSKLVMSLPQSYQGDIIINGKVVSLKMDSIQNINTFDVSVSAGRIICGDIEAKQLKLDGSTSNITLGKAIVQEDADLSFSAATFTCDQIKAKNITLDASMSNMEFKDVAGELKAKLSMGSANIVFSKVNGNADIDYSMSNVTLHFPKEAPFRVSVSGSMQSVTDNINWTDGKYRMKDAQYQINIDGSMGKVELKQN